MRSVLALLTALLLALGASVDAQTLSTTGSGTPPKPSYVGPGNIVSGATAWYGLRAYSAAVAATGTQNDVDLRRPADNATCTPKIATNGSVDLTVGTVCNSNTQTVTSWLGSAATCTGAIGPASTTITVTSCSVGTLTVGALITGSGVSANTYVTAVVGGCTAVSSCTVSVSQTVASETLTAAPSVPLVSKWYDQSGNTKDASQGTAANQPQLVLSGGPSAGLPYLKFTRASSQELSATITSVNQPWSLYGVGDRTGSTTLLNVGPFVSNGNISWAASANTLNIFVGGSPVGGAVSANDNAWHAAFALFNGASTFLKVDSTSGATGSTAGATGTALSTGHSSTTNFLDGNEFELGLWPSNISGSFAALNTNVHTYGGF